MRWADHDRSLLPARLVDFWRWSFEESEQIEADRSQQSVPWLHPCLIYTTLKTCFAGKVNRFSISYQLNKTFHLYFLSSSLLQTFDCPCLFRPKTTNSESFEKRDPVFIFWRIWLFGWKWSERSVYKSNIFVYKQMHSCLLGQTFA